MNRILKRWRREHRAKTTGGDVWRFHKATWGDLVVSVMPKSLSGRVYDSNTGVVLEAPYHRAILGQVVVNDGRMVNCDYRALDQLFGKDWQQACPVVRTVPTYRVTENDINDAWKEVIESLSKAIPRAEAEARLEMTLGWCTDAMGCFECELEIPGHFPDHVMMQARQFGWGIGEMNKPVCPAHKIIKPLPDTW